MESERDQEENPTGGGDGAPGAARSVVTLADLGPPGRGVLGLLLLCVVFAVIAFGPLVTFEPEKTLESELEGLFFNRSDTSPSVVLLLSAWFFYRRWGRLRRLPLRSGPIWLSAGLLVLAGGILGWAVFAGVRDLRVVALMATIMGAGCMLGGRPAMRALLVPTVFLIFAIPMPAPLLNTMLSHMQFWTAELTGLMLHLIGESAFVSGDQILRQGDHFAIIETCSGVRITETLTMLTILMLDLFRRSRLHGAILLVLTPLVAFFFNAVRAVTLILNPSADIAEVHTLQGIAMLLGGLITLYMADGALGWLLRNRTAAPGAEAEPAAEDSPRGSPGRRLAVLTGVLASFAAVALLLPPWQPAPRKAPSILLREFGTVGEWPSEALRVDHKFLGRIGAQREIHRRFHPEAGEVVDLFAALGARERRPRSVLYSKAMLPGSGWNTRSEGSIRLDPGGIDATWRVAVSGTRQFLVISWQEAAGGLVSESLRSFLGLDHSPFRLPGEAVVMRLSTRLGDGSSAEDRARAEERLLRFYGELRPILDGLHSDLRGDTT